MENIAMEQILGEIREERDRQDEKWGQQNHEPAHWLMILGEEVGEANKAALQQHFNYPIPGEGIHLDDMETTFATANARSEHWGIEYRKELIQVAAVAIAMIESLDRSGR